MTPPDLHRYHRQMLLPGFGEEGQRRLLRSRMLLVGCGALGTVVADSLVRAGVGHLVLADRDFVEWTNLQRQVLFDEADAAESLPKAEAARRKLAGINSTVELSAVIDDVNDSSIERLVAGCDAIVDGTDNFETRFLINDAAVKHGIPYIYGGAVGTTGMQYTVLPRTERGDAPWEQAKRATPCLRCIFDHAPPPGAGATCDTVGVLGPLVGIVASYEAAAALKVLTGAWDAIDATLLHVDPWANTQRQLDVSRAGESADCPCCVRREFEYLEGQHGSRSAVLCGRDAVQLRRTRAADQPLDLGRIADRLHSHGQVTVNDFMLRLVVRESGADYELTLFPDGRAIVKGTQEPAAARSLYARYIGA